MGIWFVAALMLFRPGAKLALEIGSRESGGHAIILRWQGILELKRWFKASILLTILRNPNSKKKKNLRGRAGNAYDFDMMYFFGEGRLASRSTYIFWIWEWSLKKVVLRVWHNVVSLLYRSCWKVQGTGRLQIVENASHCFPFLRFIKLPLFKKNLPGARCFLWL